MSRTIIVVAPEMPRTTRAIQRRVVAGALFALLALAVDGFMAGGARIALLAIVGGFAGLALYHASFGFTSAWRRFILDGRSVGLRAQLAMLALAIIVFFPLLARGSMFDQPLSGFVNPVGVALCVGAFLFGIGMQLGGGCGSGTLFTAGSGNARMLVTLAAFIAGSFAATADPLGWTHWPDVGAWSLIDALGAPAALVVALGAIGLIAFALYRVEKRHHGSAQSLAPMLKGDFARGPWPLLAGAIALALVNIATLIVAGHPWGITSAFALWGAKIAAAAGVDVAAWDYWRGDPALTRSLFADATSIMDFGLMLGALCAAGLAGKFAPVATIPARSLAAAIVGGLLMGVGGRLATGCNIGAFFSGVASGSLHGLVWLVFAIPGNAIGVRLRPLLAMENA